MGKVFLMLAAVNGLLCVLLGAFGAHGLKDTLSERMLSAYSTGVEYHFYHTLVLLALGVLLQLVADNRWLVYSGYAFLLGMVLFSGSLYALAFTGAKWLGPITPLGGVTFMVGWILLLVGALKLNG